MYKQLKNGCKNYYPDPVRKAVILSRKRSMDAERAS